MRTVWFLVAGFALLGAAFAAARLLEGGGPLGAGGTIALFVGVWAIVAAANMVIGVTQAGYSVREEFPIFLLIFLAPAIAAMLLKWRFL